MAYNPTNTIKDEVNEAERKKSKPVKAFLASVDKVLKTDDDFLKLEKEDDKVLIYNDNKKFADKDARFYGAITFLAEDTIKEYAYAYPFDKNNFTFPISGESVIILEINDKEHFYLPYTITQYPNYREDYKTSKATSQKELSEEGKGGSSKDYNQTKETGIPNKKPSESKSKQSKYNKVETIKFLKPKEGDSILSGRVGNTIRFSEFFLTEDDKTSSPGIFIRNKQNPEFDSKPIGELVEEDINKDGTSIYLTSGKVKIPFKETIKKTKIGFKNYPTSDKLKGDQLFINSDRIILSAKASEFIIYGKGNTGVITDGQYSIDAENEIYLHSNNKVTIHSAGANQIFLNSENGNVYLGKNTGAGDAGADVQKMVLGGELVKLMGDLIDAIKQQSYLTPSGTSGLGPLNISTFDSIKSKLNTLLSAKNYLSKN
jgi:hypothetical protein